MIRTIIVPEKTMVSFNVPARYVGKELEVIVFEKEEGFEKEKEIKRFLSFDNIKINTSQYIFNRDEANER